MLFTLFQTLLHPTAIATSNKTQTSGDGPKQPKKEHVPSVSIYGAEIWHNCVNYQPPKMDEIDERSVTARAGHVWSFFECNGSITISGFFKQPTFNRSAKFWLLRRLREHAAIKCGHEIDLSQLRYRHRAYTFCSVWTWCQQTPSDKQQAQPESIGDAVKAHDKGAATQSSGNAGVTAQPSSGPARFTSCICTVSIRSAQEIRCSSARASVNTSANAPSVA